MSVDLETEFSPWAIGRAIDHAYIMKPQSKETIKQTWTPKLALAFPDWQDSVPVVTGQCRAAGGISGNIPTGDASRLKLFQTLPYAPLPLAD